MVYVYYGSLAILLWKCGTQLISEINYKPLKEEAQDPVMKQKNKKLSKSFAPE